MLNYYLFEVELELLHDSGRDVIKITPKYNDIRIERSEIFRSGQIYPPGTPLDDKNAERIDNGVQAAA